jgi:CheY-like chemotaxis protein
VSAQQSMQILLVEDDHGHATLLRRALQRGGVSAEVSCFEDGEDVLAFLRGPQAETDACECYLLLLDLQLPRMGGLAVLRELRADEVLAAMRVLVLSTTECTREVREARSLGCPDLLTKPLDFERFRKAVIDLGVWNRIHSKGASEPDS